MFQQPADGRAVSGVRIFSGGNGIARGFDYSSDLNLRACVKLFFHTFFHRRKIQRTAHWATKGELSAVKKNGGPTRQGRVPQLRLAAANDEKEPVLFGYPSMPTGSSGMEPWALASATTASRCSSTSGTLMV